MNQELYGKIFGFPSCCIQYFIYKNIIQFDDFPKNIRDAGRLLAYKKKICYVPCSECADKILTYSLVKYTIDDKYFDWKIKHRNLFRDFDIMLGDIAGIIHYTTKASL